jgi:RNase adapter protein RapZ
LRSFFLEAATDILQRRYSQTRRLHPIATPDSALLHAIHEEREQLEALRQWATRIVDTGAFSVHQLKAFVMRSYSGISEKEQLSVQVLSFGFKYGLPFEADLVMDVRFLPNPYFVEELKEKDGCSEEVSEWVLKWPVAQDFISRYSDLLLSLLPCYIAEGKRYLTIAIGCTGGKHRSVVLANRIADLLNRSHFFVNVFHRDIHLE